VDSIIGRGGMGLVVKAWHLGLEEEVAIKMLRDDVAIADETIARFIREAQAAAKLKSEHIARIIDVGRFGDGKPYLVMEFLEGQDVGQLIAEQGRLQPSLAIDLVIQACEALAEAHSLGIVHRDIKPTNLFLTSRPDGSVLLKILDFGISKSTAGADLSLTQTWSLLGSPAYMSPEQMRSARHVDARTDIWSLGAVLYETIEGHLPFQAESFSEMCVMVAVDPAAPMAATPRELAPIIERCLAKNPGERYASVADLACDLACLAREPDKAQVLVDRMYRMLRRGALRRTPAGGVPQTGAPTGQLPPVTPTPSGFPPVTPTPSGFPPVMPTPSGFPPVTPTPPGLPAVDSRGATPAGGLRIAVPTPPGGMPVAADGGRAGGIPATAAYAGLPPSRPSSPLDVALGAVAAAVEAPTGPPAFAAYAHGVPLPVALHGLAGQLRPGFALPRGAAGLTSTHVISRRDRGWLVSLIAAAVVLVAAAAVILAFGNGRAARESAPVLRVIPDPAPAKPGSDPGDISPASRGGQ
jgi:serine/threonine-protein kinase